MSPAAASALGRPEAAAAIWDGHAGPRDDGAPERAAVRAARRRAARQAAINFVLGAVLYVAVSSTLGSIVIGLGLVVLVLGVVSPRRGFAWVDGLFALLVRGIGRVTTFLSMAAVLYLVLTPIGLVFRRGRRDKMKRYFERSAPTYWTKRPAAETDPRAYERLY